MTYRPERNVHTRSHIEKNYTLAKLKIVFINYLCSFFYVGKQFRTVKEMVIQINKKKYYCSVLFYRYSKNRFYD